MASPTYVGNGGLVVSASGAASFDVNLPASPVADDILFLQLQDRVVNTSEEWEFPDISGWTKIHDGVQTGALIKQHSALFWKRAGSSEPDSVTVVRTNLGGNCYGLISQWRGCVSSGTPFSTPAVRTDVNTSFLYSSSVTPTSYNSRILVLTNWLENADIGAFSGGNYSEDYDLNSAVGVDAAFSASSFAMDVPANEPERSASIGSSRAWHTYTMALYSGEDVPAGDYGVKGMVYVDSENGDDLNNGGSWSSAVKTISRAYDLLPNTWPDIGGTIRINGGVHSINELTISKPNVTIEGTGPSSVIDIAAAGTFGIKINGGNQRFRLRKCLIKCSGNNSWTGKAIYLSQNAKRALFDDVTFMSLGRNYNTFTLPQAGPCCVYFEGGNDYCDFNRFDNCEFFECYRGIVFANKANCMIDNTIMICGAREGVVADRDTGGGTIFISNSWFVETIGLSADTAVDRYDKNCLIMLSVKGDTGGTASNGYTQTKISNCSTECHYSDTPPYGKKGHIYCEQVNAQIVGHCFSGGQDTEAGVTGPIGLYLDEDSAKCIVGPYVIVGSTGQLAPTITDVSTAANNYVWEFGWDPHTHA